ncbi:MAG TPA: UvrD-helicase domain-containing protein [Thermoanaerobaculia bacterium]|nr:UvrD-helicase domain-containing protein [Thermoanaerobaculia bacterium]
MSRDLEHQLNPEQWEAVRHGEGPQLVLAGAGTGKTRVITHRVAWLIAERGVEPWRIAGVTFTNKAATEMRERVEKLLGGSTEVFLGTFHRFALRLLRRYGERVGLPRGFAILDTSDQLAVMKRALEAAQLDDSVFAPRAVLSRVSSAKNRLLGPAELERESSGFFEQGVVRAYSSYQRLLRESGGADFDDLIALAVRLLEQEEELGERMRRRLRYLLVDEFQDTNHAQLRLIETLAGRGGNLTAVGDEDQGIYRWRGAELDNILEFERHFPGAVVRKLERNYRSTQTILDASGHLVSHNVSRRGKKLWTETTGGDPVRVYRARDEADEARWIVRTLRGAHDALSYRQMAVLMRTNSQTRVLEEELMRHQVPYHLVAGTRFYERAEVKDVVAYLRVVRTPQDNLSLRRILNTPPRGIGKATQNTLFQEADELGHSLWDVLRLERFGGLSPRAANALRGFRDLVLELRSCSAELDLGELVERILERTGYEALYRKDDDEARARLENLRELVSAAQEFAEDYGEGHPAFLSASAPPSSPEARSAQGSLLAPSAAQTAAGAAVAVPARALPGSEDPESGDAPASRGPLAALDDSGEVEEDDPLTSFLDYVSLVSDTDALAADRGVSLMTLHAAKGLEFALVCVAGLEDGLIPHFNSVSEDEVEEERRLLYVGMTRARQRLMLSSCQRRRVAGRYQDQHPSPFLDELPAELLEVEDGTVPAIAPAASGVYTYFGRAPHTSSAPRGEPPDWLRRDGPPRTPRPAAAPEGLAADLPLERGQGVRHPTLGSGVILDVEGSGENAKLTVFFERGGKRRLIAKYAGLRPR